jgi:hypothetical protein
MVATRLNLGKIRLCRNVKKDLRIYPGWKGYIRSLLDRHRRGDWGDVSDCDKEKNDFIVKVEAAHECLVSFYNIPGGGICITTEDPFETPVTTVVAF